MGKKLFLLDAYALIFRAYYAFIKNPRITSKGLNTSAIYGFVNALIDVLKKESPTHIAVVFDPAGPTFRNEMFPAYKANRDATPEDIKAAIPYIKQILEALQIPAIQVSGFEADDVIGTLAFKASTSGFETYMMTPDKDYCQLVNHNIFIYKPAKGGNDPEIWGVDEVKKQFEIEKPSQVVDILALWGDASDNVPGAPGIGEKTSKQLINTYGNIENLYHNINKLTERQKKSLVENKEQLTLSRKLVTIETQVPVEFNEAEMERKEPKSDELLALFKELEFGGIASRLLQQVNLNSASVSKTSTTTQQIPNLFNQEPINNPVHNYQTIKDLNPTYHLIQSPQEVDGLIEILSKTNEFCFDTETTGLDPLQSDLVGISFSINPGEAWYVHFPQNKDDAKALAQKFAPIFANPDIKKAGQNMKFDMLMLSCYNIEVHGPLFDTMIAHYLIDPDQPHNLDSLSKTLLDYLPIPIEDLIGKKGRTQLTMRLVDLNRLKDYASEDADVVCRLKPILEEKLKELNLNSVFTDIEMPLVKVLVSMEKTGVKLDVKELKDQSTKLKLEQQAVEEELFALAGFRFNLNSPKQLGDVLFTRIKIISDPTLTKTKQFSTSEETLQKLAGKHPIIDKILDYRSLQKLVSTYTDALPLLVNPYTKRIHTSFNQAITATGRLSSTNPNLQNIPIREERGRLVRKAFIANDDSYIFISADYSQIELRLMAHFSKDASLIEAFNKNEDIHRATAAKIFKISPDEVTREQRSQAKTANFGIIYGISAFGLSERMNISRSDAKQLIDNYFETFPGVKKYMDECIRIARETGEVATLFGRKRKLADINSRNTMVRGMAERNAINSPIQGTAADIIKIAMIKIHHSLTAKEMKTKMLLQVHDELNFDVPEKERQQAMAIIKYEMEHAASLLVPLTVEIGEGYNWYEAH